MSAGGVGGESFVEKMCHGETERAGTGKMLNISHLEGNKTARMTLPPTVAKIIVTLSRIGTQTCRQKTWRTD